MHAQEMNLAAQRGLSAIFFSWVTQADRDGVEVKGRKQARKKYNSIISFSTWLQLVDVLNTMFTCCSPLAHTDCYQFISFDIYLHTLKKYSLTWTYVHRAIIHDLKQGENNLIMFHMNNKLRRNKPTVSIHQASWQDATHTHNHANRHVHTHTHVHKVILPCSPKYKINLI